MSRGDVAPKGSEAGKSWLGEWGEGLWRMPFSLRDLHMGVDTHALLGRDAGNEPDRSAIAERSARARGVLNILESKLGYNQFESLTLMGISEKLRDLMRRSVVPEAGVRAFLEILVQGFLDDDATAARTLLHDSEFQARYPHVQLAPIQGWEESLLGKREEFVANKLFQMIKNR